MTTVGNIGIGLLILIIVWIVALLIFVFAVKSENNLGWIALAVATILTIILVVLPVEAPDKDLQEKYTQDKDSSYLYRVALLLFLIVSAALGLFSVFILHCVEPVRPKPLKSF